MQVVKSDVGVFGRTDWLHVTRIAWNLLISKVLQRVLIELSISLTGYIDRNPLSIMILTEMPVWKSKQACRIDRHEMVKNCFFWFLNRFFGS